MEDIVGKCTFAGLCKWKKHIVEKLGWVFLHYRKNQNKVNCYKNMLNEFMNHYEVLRSELVSPLKIRDIEIMKNEVQLIMKLIVIFEERDIPAVQNNNIDLGSFMAHDCTFHALIEKLEHLFCHFGHEMIAFAKGDNECFHSYKKKVAKYISKIDFNLQYYLDAPDKKRDLIICRADAFALLGFLNTYAMPIIEIYRNEMSRSVSPSRRMSQVSSRQASARSRQSSMMSQPMMSQPMMSQPMMSQPMMSQPMSRQSMSRTIADM